MVVRSRFEMNHLNKGTVNETGTLSPLVFVPVVVGSVLLWGLRRCWTNTTPTNSNAVSRRRKLTRDPAAGRRPPPLPLVIQDRTPIKAFPRSDRADTTPKKVRVNKCHEVILGAKN